MCSYLPYVRWTFLTERSFDIWCIIDVSNGKPQFTIKNAKIIKYLFNEAH